MKKIPILTSTTPHGSICESKRHAISYGAQGIDRSDARKGFGGADRLKGGDGPRSTNAAGRRNSSFFSRKQNRPLVCLTQLPRGPGLGPEELRLQKGVSVETNEAALIKSQMT